MHALAEMSQLGWTSCPTCQLTLAQKHLVARDPVFLYTLCTPLHLSAGVTSTRLASTLLFR